MITKTIKILTSYFLGYVGGFVLFMLFLLVVGALTACVII